MDQIFALNCGAKSCPPIAFYNAADIDAQLDLATQAFLEGESEFDDEQKIIHTIAHELSTFEKTTKIEEKSITCIQ